MMTSRQKPPFRYFGGKADAAEMISPALGDREHYVEPNTLPTGGTSDET